MKKIINFLLAMILCAQFYTHRVYCNTSNLTWPIPQILKPGETTKEIVYIYTEDDFCQLLWLEGYYKIMERKWEAKDKIYEDALIELMKKTRPKFWSSFKGGFITGVFFLIISIWAVGQLK